VCSNYLEVLIRWLLIVFAILIAAIAVELAKAAPPRSFVEGALCVHSGWHYTSRRQHGRPDYVLWHHGYWRTWDVPDSVAGGSGEGGWHTVNSYGGGMQFTLGTFNTAARWSGGLVPYASSNAAIARLPAAVQILAAFFIVSHRGSWADWPQTSRACGLR
jgi:hypothetical protein